jgi:hypothetical protein
LFFLVFGCVLVCLGLRGLFLGGFVGSFLLPFWFLRVGVLRFWFCCGLGCWACRLCFCLFVGLPAFWVGCGLSVSLALLLVGSVCLLPACPLCLLLRFALLWWLSVLVLFLLCGVCFRRHFTNKNTKNYIFTKEIFKMKNFTINYTLAITYSDETHIKRDKIANVYYDSVQDATFAFFTAFDKLAERGLDGVKNVELIDYSVFEK